MSTIVAPSLLAANINNLKQEIDICVPFCPYLHIDIMDGKFVPAKTWDPSFVRKVSSFCPASMVKDVHLMVEDPLSCIPAYAGSGASSITFHYESCSSQSQIEEALSLIHSFNIKAGISIKPNTPVSVLLPFLDKVDLILVMSVEPGKGGQKFMPSALEKLSYLSKVRKEEGYSYLLEVDGGINGETGKLAVAAGADILVAGSYLFGHDDFQNRAKGLSSL